jgi:hypothetical protein
LYGALFAQSVPMFVINARPRYEIHTAFYPRHKNGGAHGSLHRIDSEVPLWISSAQQPHWQVPVAPRIVDLKPLILQMLQGSQAQS